MHIEHSALQLFNSHMIQLFTYKFDVILTVHRR